MVRAGIGQRAAVARGVEDGMTVEISRSDGVFGVVAPAWNGLEQMACKGVKPSAEGVIDSESQHVPDAMRMSSGRGMVQQQQNTPSMNVSEHSVAREKP
jgi:hypothetical protein